MYRNRKRAPLTDVREVGPFERMLTVTIDDAALEAAKSAAARKLAKDIKIKGFRPGKAPLRVIESTVGAATLRAEAIEEALPKAVTEAIREAELAPVTSPQVEDIRDEDGNVEVDVRVTLWPEITDLPDYSGRKVTLEDSVFDDEIVERQIERMRTQFAELEDVSRPAGEGDFVLVDVSTGRDEGGGSAKDMLYEVGSAAFLPGLDEVLMGAGAGDILEFETSVPPAMQDWEGSPDVTAKALVKGVKTRKLPDLTDEWVSDVTEFESVEEMRSELATELRKMHAGNLRARLRERLLSDVIEDTDLELPAGLVDAEAEGTLHRFAHSLEQRGISIEQYLQLSGQDPNAFVADLKEQATLNLKSRIVLEAIAEAEGLEVTDEEFDEAVAELAESARIDPDEYRKALADAGQEVTLRGDILRRKATDLIAESATALDDEGNALDLTPVDDTADDTAEDTLDDSGDTTDSGEAEEE